MQDSPQEPGDREAPDDRRSEASYDESGNGPQDRENEQALMEVIRTLRSDPEKYADLRRSLQRTQSDEEMVRALLDLSTSERELAALVPVRVGGTGEADLASTIVTITTVFILEGSAY
jgi:hypothetical protein